MGQYLGSVLTDEWELDRRRKQFWAGGMQCKGSVAGISLAGLEYCTLFTLVGGPGEWGEWERRLWVGRRQPLEVVPGFPGCSPEDLSLCSKGNGEPQKTIYSGMMQSVLWLGVITDVASWRMMVGTWLKTKRPGQKLLAQLSNSLIMQIFIDYLPYCSHCLK